MERDQSLTVHDDPDVAGVRAELERLLDTFDEGTGLMRQRRLRRALGL